MERGYGNERDTAEERRPYEEGAASQVMASAGALPGDARCMGCGYPVTHLERARCPECGREFDPGDPLSFKHAERGTLARDQWWESQRAWRDPEQLIPLLAWLAVCAAATIAEKVFLDPWGGGLPPYWACPSLALAWWVRRGVRRWVLGGTRDRYAGSERRFNVGYGILLVILVLGSYHGGRTCPHGGRYGFGPVGWGHSTVGSPCNAPEIRYWKLGERWYVWYNARG